MRQKSAWVLLSSLGLGLGLLGYTGGCDSTDGAGGNTGTGGAGGATGSTGGPSVTSTGASMGGDGAWLGMECEDDVDCGNIEGATCIAATADDPVFAGGPSHGYCSKSCQKSGDCPGASSVCFKGSSAGATEGRCVLGCTAGPPNDFIDQMLDPDKCHGREDLRCSALSNGSTVCLPGCGNDKYCPEGAVCDLRNNVCRKEAYPGKDLGAICDPAAMAPECSAVCVKGPGTSGLCSSRCVIGGDIEDCGGFDKGLCLLVPSMPADPGAGDTGFCTGACTAHDDCDNPTMWCLLVNGLLPNVGYCVPGFPKCTAQAECDALIGMKKLPAGYQCTDTPHGKYCIEPKIPLTHGGGGMGGMGGMGGSGGTGGMP